MHCSSGSNLSTASDKNADSHSTAAPENAAARADMAIIRSHAADTVTVTATASVTATVTVMDTEAIPDRMTKTVEANKQNISAFGSFVNRRLISYLFGTPCGNISFSKSPALFWYCASDIAPC